MLTSRFHLSGLVAVLLALMAQLGAAAAVPRFDPITDAAALCHTDGVPAKNPTHGTDCPICPLCATAHAPAMVLLTGAPPLTPPAAPLVLRTELPPPATTPPTLRRPPTQPRAPPLLS